jgi:hypothetical protein
MARLPDVDDLGSRPIPQSRARFVPSATPGTDIGIALTQIGAQIAEREDKLAYAKAKSDLLLADVQTRAELEKDQDWQTYEPRYRERMKKAREAAAGALKPGDRRVFEQDSGFDIERGAVAVRTLARTKEVDTGRATFDGVLETNRTAALEAHDEPTRAAFIQSTFDAIDGARRNGYINEQEAVNARQQWTARYGEGFVETRPVEERVKMLSLPKGTPAEFIAPDRRAALLKHAQNENREVRVRRESQVAEDRIFSEGGSLESMRAKARKIDDPEVRDSTLGRLEARVADREADRERGDRNLRRAAWDVILKGGKWEDIPASIVTRMDPQDGIQIKNYFASGSKGDVRTDTERWYELKQLQGENPKAFAEVDLLKFRGALSETDFQQFADAQVKINEDIRNGYGVQTDNAMVDSALRGMGIKTTAKAGERDLERASKFRYQFDQEISALQKETGRKASEDEKGSVIDRLTLEVVTKRGFFSDTTRRVFEIQPDEQIEEVVIPKDERKRIVAALQRRNIEVTEERIQALYLRARQ